MIALDTDPWRRRAGLCLDSSVVEKSIMDRCPGLSCDVESRQGMWTPKISRFKSVYYYHLHVATMDRREIPQEPVWEFQNELCKVPLAVAMRDDMPVLMLDKNGEATIDGTNDAFVERKIPQSVYKGGWKNLFYDLLRHNLPGITKEWLSAEFRVPMHWYSSGRCPIAESKAYYMARLGHTGYSLPGLEESSSLHAPLT